MLGDISIRKSRETRSIGDTRHTKILYRNLVEELEMLLLDAEYEEVSFGTVFAHRHEYVSLTTDQLENVLWHLQQLEHALAEKLDVNYGL